MKIMPMQNSSQMSTILKYEVFGKDDETCTQKCLMKQLIFIERFGRWWLRSCRHCKIDTRLRDDGGHLLRRQGCHHLYLWGGAHIREQGGHRQLRRQGNHHPHLWGGSSHLREKGGHHQQRRQGRHNPHLEDVRPEEQRQVAAFRKGDERGGMKERMGRKEKGVKSECDWRKSFNWVSKLCKNIPINNYFKLIKTNKTNFINLHIIYQTDLIYNVQVNKISFRNIDLIYIILITFYI